MSQPRTKMLICTVQGYNDSNETIQLRALGVHGVFELPVIVDMYADKYPDGTPDENGYPNGTVLYVEVPYDWMPETIAD